MKSAQRWNILGGAALTALLFWATGTATAGANLTLHDSYTNPGDPSGYGPQPGDPNPGEDRTKGWIEGTLTASSGGPLASASVTVQGWRGTRGVFITRTAANGRYRVGNLVPGQYIVSFEVAPSLTQWARQHASYPGEAFVVSANQATVVDDTALPTGTITGRFTDPEGRGEPAGVMLQSTDQGLRTLYVGAASDGTFSTPVFGGTYTVQFRRPGKAAQYAYQQREQSKAAKFTVATGATVVVNDRALPTGVIAGHLTENDGTPAAGAHVSVSGGGDFFSTTAGDDGGYQFPQVPAGEYQVNFRSADYARRQYAYRAVEFRQAAKIAVVAGQTSTVDDRFLPTGSLQVTAADEAGQPMTDFCAYTWGGGAEASACSHGSAAITFDGLPEGGTYRITAYMNGDQYVTNHVSGVAITGGQTTTKAVVFRKAAIIEATVLDNATREPVANACFVAVGSNDNSTLKRSTACSDSAGHVRIGGLEGGKRTLFVEPHDQIHGMQWVGSSGGTGSQYEARQIDAPAGAVTRAPTVYLDPAGSIAGAVTDAATGAPVSSVCVSTTALPAAWIHVGECPGNTNAAGQFRIDRLGPYRWPVEFAASSGYAWQWSGGTSSRLLAAPVKVTAGQTATSNARLSKGSVVKGRVLQSGNPVRATVELVDPVTRDAVGYGETAGGAYEVRVLPGVVRVAGEIDAPPYTRQWYRNAADFDHATPVLVGLWPVTLDLVVPAS